MEKIYIDVSTYSNIDKHRFGIYKHIESNAFALNAVCYMRENDKYATVVDMVHEEEIPEDIFNLFMNENVLKYAVNADFVRVCFEKRFRVSLNTKSWRSIYSIADYNNLSKNMDILYMINRIENSYKEMKKLKLFFGKPTCMYNGIFKCANPNEYPNKWERLLEYMRENMLATKMLIKKIGAEYENSDIWEIERIKNDGGKQGILINESVLHDRLKNEYRKGLDIIGKICDKLQIYTVDELNKSFENTDDYVDKLCTILGYDLRELEILKSNLSKYELDKYKIMKKQICKDGRLRKIDAKMFNNIYSDKAVLLKDMDKKYCVINYYMADVCIMAWLANENWILEEIYCKDNFVKKFIEKMNIENLEKPEYVCEIIYSACIYGGKDIALIKKDNKKLINDFYIEDIVNNWQLLHSQIVKLWGKIHRAFYYVIMYHTEIQIGFIRICWSDEKIKVLLPSGREIYFLNPKIERCSQEQIAFSYVDYSANNRRVIGKGTHICRWIVNAIKTDIINALIVNMEYAGYKTLFEINNSIIIEITDGDDKNRKIHELLQIKPMWATSLPLYEQVHYME